MEFTKQSYLQLDKQFLPEGFEDELKQSVAPEFVDNTPNLSEDIYSIDMLEECLGEQYSKFINKISEEAIKQSAAYIAFIGR